jgi:glycosyltransferase involved in cell wall biosynthesis
MSDSICLDEKYSTTRVVTQEQPPLCYCVLDTESNQDKFETGLFLPDGEGRKGEGGLRTKGYFKNSYEGKHLISIITVVYNGEQYIEETIQSVINQTYDNVEYIIIDGGSTDRTLNIIKKYEDKIDYWVSEKDNGIYDAMNRGLEILTGDFIIMLNAGDYFYGIEVLSLVVSKITKTDEVYFAQAEVKSQYTSYLKPKNGINYSEWLNNHLPIHQTVLVPKKLKYIKYDESLKITADSLYLKTLLSVCKFNYIDELMIVFSLGGVSSYYKNYSHFILHTKEHLKYLSLTNASFMKKIYIIVAFSGKYILRKVINEKKYYAIIKKLKKY